MKIKSSALITYLLIILISFIFIFLGYQLCKSDSGFTSKDDYYTARVLTITETIKDEYSFDGPSGDTYNETIFFTAEITSNRNDFKGQIINGQQYIDNVLSIAPDKVGVGDEILLLYASGFDSEDKVWQFAEKNRINKLIIFIISFLLLIIIVGRRKGFSTIIALVFTISAIFLVYIPSILKGYNIYISTIIICFFIIIMSLLILNGINKKSLCAILGNIGGVIVAGILALLMLEVLGITGDVKEDYLLLMHLDNNIFINLKGVVWGSILIGSLGAIMDVSMSISSALNELSENVENKSFGKLLKSGMNIGKDAIGTMTNTLILAYIGGSMATVLLLMAYSADPLYFFNLEMIVVEILLAIVGSMGILFSVPATAFFAAYIYTKK